MQYEPMVFDRVVVAVAGKVVKARVASTPGFGKVGVTFAKGESAQLFQIVDVFPLYRYMKMTDEGPVVVNKAEQSQGVVPLFLIPTPK